MKTKNIIVNFYNFVRNTIKSENFRIGGWFAGITNDENEYDFI